MEMKQKCTAGEGLPRIPPRQVGASTPTFDCHRQSAIMGKFDDAYATSRSSEVLFGWAFTCT